MRASGGSVTVALAANGRAGQRHGCARGVARASSTATVPAIVKSSPHLIAGIPRTEKGGVA
jgi:hypothetical protein